MKTIDLTKIKKHPSQNHTSKGNQPKWFINNEWYKADHMGYEALSEYIVSEFLKKSNVSDFVSYELIKINDGNSEKTGCVSKNFKKNNEMLIPLERLHRAYFGKGLADALSEFSEAEEKITYTVKFIEETTGLSDVGEYFSIMLEIDAFFLNEDRHTNNIAVIRNEDTKEFKLAPIFDNGLSLLSDLNDYPLDTDIYESISKVKAKPFDTDFNIQLDTAEGLYGSHLKLDIKRSDIYKIFGNLKSWYPDEIIDRAQRIVFEQFRKYSGLFL